MRPRVQTSLGLASAGQVKFSTGAATSDGLLTASPFLKNLGATQGPTTGPDHSRQPKDCLHEQEKWVLSSWSNPRRTKFHVMRGTGTKHPAGAAALPAIPIKGHSWILGNWKIHDDRRIGLLQAFFPAKPVQSKRSAPLACQQLQEQLAGQRGVP